MNLRFFFRLSMVKYFALPPKALSQFLISLKHNYIGCLWNVNSLSVVIPIDYSQGIGLTVEPSISNWLVPEFAASPLCLNEANMLLMVGSKNSIASA